MPYSSYSNYLDYKNCKKRSLPCYNNFDSYKKYNRSLTCTRAWWTNTSKLQTPLSAKGMTIEKYAMSQPCKTTTNITCDTNVINLGFDVTNKCYCSSIKKCCNN